MRIVWKDSISRAKKGSASTAEEKKKNISKVSTKKEEAVSS